MERQSRAAISVEKMIALKRHEQPPPGYFRLLPDRIINRIEHGEGPSSFWEKWGPAFRVRAVLAYALGLTVCTALTVGVWFSPKLDQGAGGSDSRPGSRWAVESVSTASVETPLGGARWLGSTNPVTAPRLGDSLFLTPEGHAIPVSLYLGN